MQPGYTEIYKNNLPSTPYDVIIMDGDKEDKSFGYKGILSYPYDTQKIFIGDYAYFTYGETLSTWLIMSLDNQFLFETNGRILKCNHSLKWYDETETLITYPCVIDIIKKTGNPTIDGKQMVMGNADRYISIQSNPDTLKFVRDKRFIFENRAWKITDIDTKNGTAQLSLSEDSINVAIDDLDNEIAGITMNIPTTVVIPSTSEILQGGDTLPVGQTRVYEIYKYVSGVALSNTYTFIVSNSNLVIESVTGNSVTVKATSTVNVSCVISATNIVSSNVISKTITTSSLW